jgi:hypothetical protein
MFKFTSNKGDGHDMWSVKFGTDKVITDQHTLVINRRLPANDALKQVRADLETALQDANAKVEALCAKFTPQALEADLKPAEVLALPIKAYRQAYQAALLEQADIDRLNAAMAKVIFDHQDPPEYVRAAMTARLAGLPLAARIQAANGSTLNLRLLIEAGPLASGFDESTWARLVDLQKVEGAKRMARPLTAVQALPTLDDPLRNGVDQASLEVVAKQQINIIAARQESVDDMRRLLTAYIQYCKVLVSPARVSLQEVHAILHGGPVA